MRKNRRLNELFIGNEFLNLEGRTIKHPALIQYYANLNVNKTRDDMIGLFGMDVETDAETGEMKLLGFYEGNSDNYEGNYRSYTDNLIDHLIMNIKYAIKKQKNIAYWRSFDAIQIMRLFILHDYSESRQADALERYGKVSGEFNRKTHEWEVRPVIVIDRGHFIIGVKQVIRDSMQFFIQNKASKLVSTCWGFNIASLYLNGLEKEADDSKGGRFEWYSKLDEEAHIVDWKRFDVDEEYRNLVLKSNELDARGAMGLGFEVQKDFKEAFGAFPVSLISQGGHARSAIVAQINNDLIKDGYNKEEIKYRKLKMLNSIPIMTHLDRWLEKYDEKVVKDLYFKFTEAYSGGYIEAIMFGYTKKGWFADIASAYPAVIKTLWDLTGSKLKYGEGDPPDIKYSYVFIRGLVRYPMGVDYHSITIKHPVDHGNNIRPTGSFKATYTKDERDFALSLGATFSEESWTSVITKGKISVLGNVTNKLIDLRNRLIKEGKLAEAQVKRMVNSLYGIQFEAVNIHEEIEGKPERVGYRAGEFWNPLYATIITSRTRLILAKACTEIVKNGGKPIILMTDSITWEGKKTDLPKILKFKWGESGIKLEKTLGYFEDPEEIRDMISFGSGRYGFRKFNIKDNKWYYTNKRRGLNIVDIDDPEGVVVSSEFSWENIMKEAVHNNSTNIKVKVRSLLSVATIRKQSKVYSIYDLGRIVEQFRDVDLVGNKKRLFNPDIYDINKLNKGLIKTKAIHLSYGMFVEGGVVDGTLPMLREKASLLKMTTKKIRKRITTKKRQKKFYDNNKDDFKIKRKEKYKISREGGFNRNDAVKMMSWSFENIDLAIKERRKESEKERNIKEIVFNV